MNIYLSPTEKSAIAQLDQETVEAALVTYRWVHERTDGGIKQFRKGGVIDDQYCPRILAYGSIAPLEISPLERRTRMLVHPFADAEGLSTFEAIAVLSGGRLPWALRYQHQDSISS